MKNEVANFTGGPGLLTPRVEQGLNEACCCFGGARTSIRSTSHRHREVEMFVERMIEMIKRIMAIPSGYSVVFVPGGASAQFHAWMLNMISDIDGRLPRVGYMDSGIWGQKAYASGLKLAKGGVCETSMLAAMIDSYRGLIPINRVLESAQGLDYVHMTSNETADGTQHDLDKIPKGHSYKLIADMSSDIMSRRFDVSKFDYIYAGAQKNLGIAGVTIVIVRDGLFGPAHPLLPEPLVIANQKKAKGALYNTADVEALYSVYLTMQWIEEEGGLPEMERWAQARASLFYGALDKSALFEAIAHHGSRSLMNATFRLSDPSRNDAFKEYTENEGIVGIGGHAKMIERNGPCYRASMYNAQTMENMRLLVDVMAEFERRS